MKTSILRVLVSVVALSTAYAYDPKADIQTLATELGTDVGQEIVLALQDPALLPANGVHQPVFIWNVSADTPSGGALAMILPAAVRVGHEVLRRSSEGGKFTDTFVLRRILNATQMWDANDRSDGFFAGWQAVQKTVDPAKVTPGSPFVLADATPLGSFDVSEISGPVGQVLAASSGGGLQCCYLYTMTIIPQGFICQYDGSSCEMCAPCGPGQPPVLPNPSPGPPAPTPPPVARPRKLQITGGGD